MPSFCSSSYFLLQGLNSHSREQRSEILPRSEVWKVLFARLLLPKLLCPCSVVPRMCVCCREPCWSWGERLHRTGSDFGQGCREVLFPLSWEEKSSELGSSSGESCWEFAFCLLISFNLPCEMCQDAGMVVWPPGIHLFLLLTVPDLADFLASQFALGEF